MAPSTANTSSAVVIEGFTLIQTKFTESSKAGHYLYVKQHSVRESHVSKPRDRTLFVANIPPYVTEQSLKQCFGGYGKVQNVHLHKKPTAGAPEVTEAYCFQSKPPSKGFKVAYIVYESPKSVTKATNTPFDEFKILQHPSIKLGVDRYISEHCEKVRDPEKFQAEIDNYMAKYDKEQEEEKNRAQEQDGVADEDGWVTVTRHGKNKGIPRTEANQQRTIARDKKRRREKELLNFYSYQIRENKRDDIAKLREKFEADKSKIELMKAQRKFKPY